MAGIVLVIDRPIRIPPGALRVHEDGGVEEDEAHRAHSSQLDVGLRQVSHSLEITGPPAENAPSSQPRASHSETTPGLAGGSGADVSMGRVHVPYTPSV